MTSDILKRAEELLSDRYKGGQSVTTYLNFCKRQYEAFIQILPDLLTETKRLKDELTNTKELLEEFRQHEEQTHAAMEVVIGNSDCFIELTKSNFSDEDMKTLAEILRPVLSEYATKKNEEISRLQAIAEAANEYRKSSMSQIAAVCDERDRLQTENKKLKLELEKYDKVLEFLQVEMWECPEPLRKRYQR